MSLNKTWIQINTFLDLPRNKYFSPIQLFTVQYVDAEHIRVLNCKYLYHCHTLYTLGIFYMHKNKVILDTVM
jgi:hypothetical protein